MTALVEAANPDLPPQALAKLSWSTDPDLNAYMFGPMDVARKITAREWPAEWDLLRHKPAFSAMDGEALPGILIGHTTEEYGANFEAALVLQTPALSATEAEHVTLTFHWMDRLFPDPRQLWYYVRECAVAPQERGSGLASHLRVAAGAYGRARGCNQVCLHVAADNDVAGLRQHIGFSVEIEIRVPFFHVRHGIGSHFHMVRRLDPKP